MGPTILAAMRRLPALVLMLAVAALGSGALRYVHELEHAARGAQHHHEEPANPPHGDGEDTNCFLHAKLNLPMLSGGYVAVLVCVGMFVAFFTSPAALVLCRRPVLLLDSRGPPVR